MRGKASFLSSGASSTRITPAYAGKSYLGFCSVWHNQDHPRLCGEKLSGTWSTTSAAGSPPPMRGKVLWSGCTPYASKDHPRLCGEKYGYYTIEVSSLGSPPPMRGKAALPACLHFFTRITPAYAGKSFRTAKRSQEHRDHPRLCGEKCSDSEFFYQNLGSPPPMRGKDSQRAFHGIMTRITPAYAGKSRTTARAIFRQKDHPRLCGEKFVKCSRSFTLSGSPPPMRGKGYRCW